jgi:hypothetical protein
LSPKYKRFISSRFYQILGRPSNELRYRFQRVASYHVAGETPAGSQRQDACATTLRRVIVDLIFRARD